MEPNVSPTAATGRPVRRRKHNASRWLRVVIVGIPVLLLGVVAVIVGLRWWLDRFLQSEEFRRTLDARTSVALRADCRFEPLRWQGSGVYSAGLDAKGGSTGPWNTFAADQMRAELNLSALWHRVWRIESIDIERITAEMKPGLPRDDAEPPEPEIVSSRSSGDHFLIGLLPKRVEIGEVRVGDLSLRWASDNPSIAGRVQGVRLNARPLDGLKRWEVNGRDGTLTQSGLPPVVLDGFNIKADEKEVYITRASGHAETGGRVDFSGTQSLAGDKMLDLRLHCADVPVETFLPPDWRSRLHGKASGSAHVTGSATAVDGWKATGHIDLHDGHLEALPILDELALFTSTARYRQAAVQRGSADYTWSPDVLTVSNVVLESEGLLRLEGAFTVRQDQIDGQFQVGVAATVLRWLPGTGGDVFNQPQHDGYVWTTMRLTGPVRSPHEDLTARLAGSVEKEVARKAQQGAETLLHTASDLLDLIRPR